MAENIMESCLFCLLNPAVSIEVIQDDDADMIINMLHF